MEKGHLKEKVEYYVVLDNEKKDIERQMDGLKSDFISYAKEVRGSDKSVIIDGDENKLQVTFAESLSVNNKIDEFKEIEKRCEKGELSDLFDKKVSLNIPPEKTDEVMRVLGDAGLLKDISVTTKWSVVKKEYDKIRKNKFADLEKQGLSDKVRKVICVSVSPRIQVK